jgi:hypothetical protein
MKRIDGQMKGHRIIADEVLSCIIHAHRPITIDELRYIMALTPGETKIDPDALPEEEDLKPQIRRTAPSPIWGK